MNFVLHRTGLISAVAPDSAVVTIVTEGDGWHWRIDEDVAFKAGNEASLDEALAACVAEVSPGTNRWAIDLPCGGQIPCPANVPAEEALAYHGYAKAEGGRAYLSISMQSTATPAQARAVLMTILDEDEREALGSVDLVEREGVLSHWCADLPLPVSGFVHQGQMGALAHEALSPGAAHLVVGVEADPADVPAPAPSMAT